VYFGEDPRLAGARLKVNPHDIPRVEEGECTAIWQATVEIRAGEFDERLRGGRSRLRRNVESVQGHFGLLPHQRFPLETSKEFPHHGPCFNPLMRDCGGIATWSKAPRENLLRVIQTKELPDESEPVYVKRTLHLRERVPRF
jgi:hypothetical protein